MTDWNLLAAWIGMLLGVCSGALTGLMFHRPDWLGGYSSWPRRMIRLGHIAFFGIAFLNLAFAATVRGLGWVHPWPGASLSLAAANILMPAVCFLAGWKPSFRHLFFIPVGCVLVGIVGVLLARVSL